MLSLSRNVLHFLFFVTIQVTSYIQYTNSSKFWIASIEATVVFVPTQSMGDTADSRYLNRQLFWSYTVMWTHKRWNKLPFRGYDGILKNVALTSSMLARL